MVLLSRGLSLVLFLCAFSVFAYAEPSLESPTIKNVEQVRLSERQLFKSYLLTYRDKITSQDLAALDQLLSPFRDVEVKQLIERVVLITVPDKVQREEALDEIRLNLQVEIEPNFAVNAQAAGPLQQAPQIAAISSQIPQIHTPQPRIPDPLAPLWYTDATRVSRHPQSLLTGPVAHDETTGNSDYVTIHTVDTRLSPYEYLFSNELKRPSTTRNVGGYGGNSIEHGSYVSYIAHGTEGNGIGSHGVCPGCDRKAYTFDISNVSSLEDITARMSDVLTLFNQMRTTIDRPANIVNMSWGLPFSSPALRALMVEAEEWGVHMVAAVGNEDRARPLYPADFPQVIAVGATGVDDGNGGVDPTQRAQFSFPNNLTGASNRGPDIVAPGYKVPVPNFSFSGINWDLDGFGTSFATPHVSGALGLIWSYFLKDPLSFPQAIDLIDYWPNGAPRMHLLAEYFRELLERSATDIVDPGFDEETGHGLLDVNGAFSLLKSDANDFNSQISTGLTHGVQEWGGNFGGTILAMLQQRLNGTPETKFVFEDGPYEYGSCWHSRYNYIKIQTSRPRFFTKVRNFTLTPISVNGDEAKVRISYDLGLDGYVRFKVKTVAQCVFWLPGVSGKFNLNWAARTGSNQTTLELDLKLSRNGYKVHNVTRVNSPLKDLQYNAQLAGYTLSQSHYQDFVQQQIGEAKLFLRDILEPTLDQDLVTMTERAVNATLFQERNRPYKYFYKRAGETALGGDVLRLRGVSRDTNFSHVPFESLSSFSVANPAPQNFDFNLLNPPVLTNQPLVFPQATSDSATNVGQNIFNAQLAYLYNAGAFEQAGMGQGQTTTGTSLYPQGLQIGFSDASFYGIPYFWTYAQAQSDYYGELNISQSIKLTVSAGSFNYDDYAVVVWSIPFRLRDLHKEIDRETDGELKPAQFEQRFVPDFTNASLIVVPDTPGNLYSFITQPELEEAYRRLVGMKYLRVTSSLSSHRMAGEALLGDYWGCTEHLLEMINFYSKLDGGKDLVDHVYSNNCFNLNVGYFRPSNFEQAVSHGSHLTRATNIAVRTEVTPLPAVSAIPDLNLVAPNNFDYYTYGGLTYSAAFVDFNIATASSNAEVNYSYDGLFRTKYEDQKNVKLVEELWQWNPGEIWVPNIGRDFKVLALAREKSELVVSSECNQEVKVRFQYDGVTPPQITQNDTGKLNETTVFDREDSWFPMNCGNGHGEPGGKDPRSLSGTHGELHD